MNNMETATKGRVFPRHRFADCRPFSTDEYTVEACAALPDIQIEIRRFRWNVEKLDRPFRPQVCCLGLALAPRPAETQVANLGEGYRHAYMPVGECSFFPAGHEVWFKNPAVERHVLVCMFDPGRMQPYIDWPWSPVELAVCTNIRNFNIRSGLARLADEILAPGFASHVFVEAIVTALIVELVRHFRTARRSAVHPAGNKLAPWQLQRIQDLVDQVDHPAQDVATLASECGISPRHLTRIFKGTTGLTLRDYIANRHIRFAKRRLSERDALIKTVALECGFSSQAAFSAAFRRATGFCPREFRNRLPADRFGMVDVRNVVNDPVRFPFVVSR